MTLTDKERKYLNGILDKEKADWEDEVYHEDDDKCIADYNKTIDMIDSIKKKFNPLICVICDEPEGSRTFCNQCCDECIDNPHVYEEDKKSA